MPWKECSVMDERVRFVGRLLDGEKMVALCREFAISRKTGYKIFDRYKEYGLEALIWNDLSTRNSVLVFFFHSCSSQEAAQVAVGEAKRRLITLIFAGRNR